MTSCELSGGILLSVAKEQQSQGAFTYRVAVPLTVQRAVHKYFCHSHSMAVPLKKYRKVAEASIGKIFVLLWHCKAHVCVCRVRVFAAFWCAELSFN